MIDNLKFKFEEIHENENIYEIINQRLSNCNIDYNIINKEFEDININDLNNLLGLNDICYLIKDITCKSLLGMSKKKTNKSGSYHYINGLDTSNVGYISVYVNKYVQSLTYNLKNSKKEKDTTVSQSIFCIYDIFQQKDLRILINFPGGVRKVFYIEQENVYEVKDNDYRTIFLSSFIRTIHLKDEKINNTAFLDIISTSESFNYLNESIYFIIKENAEYKYTNFKFKITLLLESYIKYMINNRRFNQAIISLSKLTILDNSIIKYTIIPLKKLELFEDALSYIASILVQNNNLYSLFNVEVDLLLSTNKLDDALQIAKFNTSINPDISHNWITLSKVYLKLNKYDTCLRALNNVNFLNQHKHELINKTQSNLCSKCKNIISEKDVNSKEFYKLNNKNIIKE